MKNSGGAMKRQNRGLLAAAGVLFALAVSLAHAQVPTESAKIAQMQGADRQQRLVEGAKKEGELTLYTSAPVDDVAVLTGAFEKKYGVKVKVWRAGSEKVMQRAVTEARAGRFDVDIIDTNGPEMEALHREKLLTEVKSPYLGDLIPQAIQPHREWVGSRINIFAAAYNTKMVKKEDLPKTYADLLDPKWKGKLGIEAEDWDWFAGVLRRAPHPHAAVLYFDFTFSDAQALLLKRSFVPTSKKVKTVLNQMPLKFIDPSVILDQEAKWNKLYQETIVKQSR